MDDITIEGMIKDVRSFFKRHNKHAYAYIVPNVGIGVSDKDLTFSEFVFYINPKNKAHYRVMTDEELEFEIWSAYVDNEAFPTKGTDNLKDLTYVE